MNLTYYLFNSRAQMRFSPIKFFCGVVSAALLFFIGVFSGASIKIPLLFCPIIVLLSAITISPKSIVVSKFFHIGAILFISAATLFVTQYVNNASYFYLPLNCIISSFFLVLTFYLVIYTAFPSNSISLLIGFILLLIFSTANYYVFLFRGSELVPYDLLTLTTAMNVIEEYTFSIPPFVFVGWTLAITILFGLLSISVEHIPKNIKSRRLKAGVSAIICFLLFNICSSGIVTFHFQNGGSWYNGYLLNFVLSINESIIHKPDRYQIDVVESVAQNYSLSEPNDNLPNIVVIMNESFSDFCVLNEDFCRENDILPFYHSLKENVISGYALSPTIGGKTPNPEFEFLTGNSMAFLPNGAVPYQQFIREDTYSMVSYLNSLGYFSMATHPFRASGWNRPVVYDRLGFHRATFIEDYPQNSLIRDFISDQEMYEYIVHQYEIRPADHPFFIFGVTMQNHGGYTHEDFNNTVFLDADSAKYTDAAQYLSLMQLSDHALKYLVEYFSSVSEDVLLVIFGDHFPALDNQFYETVYGGNFASLHDQMNVYKVPFLIWANYDIEEAHIPCTSINFLSNYLYSAAHIPLPVYNQYLNDLHQIIPALNPFCFYSLEQNCLLPFDQASPREESALNLYRCIQYNGLFDWQNRNLELFPIYTPTSE